jgi:predicted nucleotidyltransferase
VRSKTLADVKLEPRVRAALEAARDQLIARFDIDRLVLYGSVARGEADEESDVDLLIVLRNRPDLPLKNEISTLLYHINLDHDTNLSGLIVDRDYWERGMISAMPIHREVEQEGITL